METNTGIQCQGRTAASSPVIHAVMAQEIPIWRILVISLPGTLHSDPLGQVGITIKTTMGTRGEKGLQQLWC